MFDVWRYIHSIRHSTGIGQTDRWTDRETDRQTDGRTEGRTDGRTDRIAKTNTACWWASGVNLSYKMWGWGQSDQAIKLFQAPRKINFTFHFLTQDTSLLSLITWNLQNHPATVLNERMRLFFGGGGESYWPIRIFWG